MANMKKFLFTAATALVLATGTVGMAAAAPHNPPDKHGDKKPGKPDKPGHPGKAGNPGKPDKPGHPGKAGKPHHAKHDRYWKPGFHGYVAHDRVHRSLKRHGYHRWSGAPYWYQDHYVIRTFDPAGRVIFVEINPYTGDFIGVIRF